jgi:hypothetical protein
MEIKPGSTIFTFRPWDPISEIIAFFTFPIMHDGVLHHVSHAERVVDVGSDPDKVQVASADASGMTIEWIQLSDIPFWVAKDDLDMPDLLRQEIIRWAWAHEGEPYNFSGLLSFPLHIDLNMKNHLYCSQAVYDNNLLLLTDHFKDPRCEGKALLRDCAWVSPAHLFTSPYLSVVGSK